MVFPFRPFSCLSRQEERTQTFYTATTDFGSARRNSQPAPSLLAEKTSNLRVFRYAELKAATKNFQFASFIGQGGYGEVFRGVIKSLEHPFDEIQIAVKRPHTHYQGHKEWVAEVNVLGVVQHPNLVKLIGYCFEDVETVRQRLLVYEYMPNRTVKDHLSATSEAPLSWTNRLKVARDAACGLEYLHEKMDDKIIFRDFKSSNILLDDNWNAKLSDFGLARLGPPEGVTHVSTAVAGTMGYAAPEYIQTGHLTYKSDVWSYGVFLCELITGKPPLNKSRPNNDPKLLELVKPYIGSKKSQLTVDPRLEGTYSLESVHKLSVIANKCLSRNPKSRPKMSEVVEMVNHVIQVSSHTTNPRSERERGSTDVRHTESTCLSRICCV